MDVTAMNEELYEKLVILNYESYFVKQKYISLLSRGSKPLNTAYFTYSFSATE